MKSYRAALPALLNERTTQPPACSTRTRVGRPGRILFVAGAREKSESIFFLPSRCPCLGRARAAGWFFWPRPGPEIPPGHIPSETQAFVLVGAPETTSTRRIDSVMATEAPGPLNPSCPHFSVRRCLWPVASPDSGPNQSPAVAPGQSEIADAPAWPARARRYSIASAASSRRQPLPSFRFTAFSSAPIAAGSPIARSRPT
jgi:hypothetical protein